eukprot:Gregarina_sp_Poly_1__5202@NODE_2758_length_1751_cov_128_258314_g1740_i0_p1_GENE_NODE_2758_length_1751_cov_128_258314_g1740_i0NODE_2758_length_1751_cov_128_258314_g1740_i0_p1_ORF_typecomplete_len257_score43_93Adaptin_binding/PF10199_9/33Adaptin_binding/PF10199_9/0_018Rubredoxin_2/PF18073_1/0_25_NODE_2758_length_1751_cov_128_258314_g1740_i04411211
MAAGTQHEDKVVFLSLDDEAHANFEVLVPQLLGADPACGEWNTNYSRTSVTWELLRFDNEHCSHLNDSTLCILGSSSFGQQNLERLNIVLTDLHEAVVILFGGADPAAAVADLHIETSLDHELIAVASPSFDRSTEADDIEFWQQEIHQARESRPLSMYENANCNSDGLRRLIEILDLTDWKDKRLRSKQTQFAPVETPTTQGEDTLHDLDQLLSDIQGARADALSGAVSDENRREKAAALVSQLMAKLSLGHLSE